MRGTFWHEKTTLISEGGFSHNSLILVCPSCNRNIIIWHSAIIQMLSVRFLLFLKFFTGHAVPKKGIFSD